MANNHTNYNDEELCNDIAKADLPIAEIALKHKISARQVYAIAKGDSRPELRERIDELIQAEKSAGMRLARSRARWAVARLIQLASQDTDKRAAAQSIDRLLGMAGMSVEGGGTDKQQIEILLSTGNGNGNPMSKRLTGVYNPSSEN